MIPDFMLRAAAAKSCDIYAVQLQSGYDADRQHIFLPAFETKIRKLKRRADHPFFYRSAQCAASVLLALLICAGAWLAIDVEARTAVFGWIKEVCESFFIYRYENDSDPEVTPMDFRPYWLPDGYSEFAVNDTADTITVIYANDAGEMMKFSYAHNPDQTDWFIDISDADRTSVTINGYQADLFLSSDPDVAGGILWTSSDDTAFFISGFLSEEDFKKVAENIRVTDK